MVVMMSSRIPIENICRDSSGASCPHDGSRKCPTKGLYDAFKPNGLHFRKLAVVKINLACHFLRDNPVFSSKTLLNLNAR